MKGCQCWKTEVGNRKFFSLYHDQLKLENKPNETVHSLSAF